MPESALWGLVISLVLLAFGLGRKLTEADHRAELRSKAIDRLVAENAEIKKEKEKAVTRLSELENAGTPKIVEKYEAQLDVLRQKVDELQDPSQGRMLKQLEQEIDFSEKH